MPSEADAAASCVTAIEPAVAGIDPELNRTSFNPVLVTDAPAGTKLINSRITTAIATAAAPVTTFLGGIRTPRTGFPSIMETRWPRRMDFLLLQQDV
jgi:hypothetical protein